MTEAPMPGGQASAPLSPWGQESSSEWGSVLTTPTSSALPSLEAPRDRCFLPPTTNQCPFSIHPPKEWCSQFLLFSTLQMQTSVRMMQC